MATGLAAYGLVTALWAALGAYLHWEAYVFRRAPYADAWATQRATGARMVVWCWAWPVLLLAALGRWIGAVAVDAGRKP